MSHYDYKMSQEIGARDYPFYALVMACFRQADTYNLRKLRQAFPLAWLEFTARYNAPGGLLEGEKFVHPLEKYFGPCEGYWEEAQVPELPETIMGIRDTSQVTEVCP